jgi:hypothetical protein
VGFSRKLCYSAFTKLELRKNLLVYGFGFLSFYYMRQGIGATNLLLLRPLLTVSEFYACRPKRYHVIAKMDYRAQRHWGQKDLGQGDRNTKRPGDKVTVDKVT